MADKTDKVTLRCFVDRETADAFHAYCEDEGIGTIAGVEMLIRKAATGNLNNGTALTATVENMLDTVCAESGIPREVAVNIAVQQWCRTMRGSKE